MNPVERGLGLAPGRYGTCESGAAEPCRNPEIRMAMQFRTSGCLYSIIVSIVLTVLLNLALRGCSGVGPAW